MTTTVTLKYPVTVDGQEYTSLTMRRPKVKDRRVAAKQKTDEDKEITLISNLCDVPPSVIDELDSADYNHLQKALIGFFDSTTES